MTETQKCFFRLLRIGVGKNVPIKAGDVFDWGAIQTIAAQHGLSAFVLDAIECLPEGKRPDKALFLPWIGEVVQDYDVRYEQYSMGISSLAAFYNEHGFKMMIVKGISCGLTWPKPEHRPYGDVDIWLFGKYKEADAAIAKEKGIRIHNSHHHHTVFYWKNLMIENHYNFINIHHHKSNIEFERILEDLAEDDTYSIDLAGQKVYLPSPNLHALFLLKHSFSHFASTDIDLRQVLDWGFYVQAHSAEIDWKWLVGVLDRFGMRRLFNIFNAICVEDLGFAASLFPELRFSPVLKDRVLAEILSPEFSGETPSKFFPRIAFKFRRWRANAWKHRLCYRESLWSAFWSGVWNHLLKPASI